MARKVLISFLGTGNYHPVYYSWKGKKATDTPTKFIQEAIAANVCKDWKEKDCIMVFRTEDSNKENWLDSEKKGIGLASTLRAMRELKCRVNPEKERDKDTYIIPFGFSEQETESIFKDVFEKLEDGDEIHFDMTHAFRSIPIFATTLFNYARFLKDVKVKGLYYGAFEAIRNGAETAPIVDMSDMVRLQDLTMAAASFNKAGNVGAFSELLAFDIEEGEDETVDKIINALDDLDLYIQTSRIPDIQAGKYMRTINASLEDFCKSTVVSNPQRLLLQKIQQTLTKAGFKPSNDYANVEAAIKWAMNHDMIQQAYTMVKEYLITRVYDLFITEGLDDALLRDAKKTPYFKPEYQTYGLRNAVGEILKGCWKKDDQYVTDRNGNYMQDNKVKAKYPSSEILIKRHPSIKGLFRPYIELANSRNFIAHAGTTAEGYEKQKKEKKDYSQYQQEFNRCWTECKEALKVLD